MLYFQKTSPPKISLNAIIICSIYDELVARELHTFSEIAIANSTRQKNFENCKFCVFNILLISYISSPPKNFLSFSNTLLHIVEI